MKSTLQATIDELVNLFASAREGKRSGAALRCWNEARSLLDANREDGNLWLDRLGSCVESLEFVMRRWANCGFETSYRLAGEMLESAWSAVESNTASRASLAA